MKLYPRDQGEIKVGIVMEEGEFQTEDMCQQIHALVKDHISRNIHPATSNI
jgi:hypothetical protein